MQNGFSRNHIKSAHKVMKIAEGFFASNNVKNTSLACRTRETITMQLKVFPKAVGVEERERNSLTLAGRFCVKSWGGE
jgi:hypothetical protein